MLKTVLIMAIATLVLVAGVELAVNMKATSPALSRRYSQEMLERIRHSLTAQIAVREDSEGMMRAPTPEEAAALARPDSTEPPLVVPLQNGGVALRGDPSQMEFIIAELGEDGTVKVSHGTAPKPAAKNDQEEASHVR